MNENLVFRALKPVRLPEPAKGVGRPRPVAARLVELGVTVAWKTKNPTFDDLQAHYAPCNWGRMMANPSKAYTWVCPTVGALDEIYGPGSSEEWIDQQVTALFLTSASREGNAASTAIGAFVSSFTASVSGYRLSELMLFFARYKTGLYDRSFATFDVRRIGLAFHHEFLPERRRELAHVEEELQAEKSLRERNERERHAVSFTAFHSADRRTAYGVRLRLRVPLDSCEAVKVARYLGLSLPLESAECEIRITRWKMRLLARWQQLHWVEVTDSWTLDRP